MPKEKAVVIVVVGSVNSTVGMHELKDFVDDALSTWGGQRHPDDHLFDSINVALVIAKHVADTNHDAD